MRPGTFVNLDIWCAEAGYSLSEAIKEEKILNDALAVLEEHGPYAMFLYIQARHPQEASHFERPLVDLLKKTLNRNREDALTILKSVADDLDALLFARDLLRTALIYARFHLKAKGGE